MSPSTERNHTQFFSVVGAAYVPEEHDGRFGHLAGLPELEQLKLGVSGLWLAFFAMIGASLIGNGQPAKAVQIAAQALH